MKHCLQSEHCFFSPPCNEVFSLALAPAPGHPLGDTTDSDLVMKGISRTNPYVIVSHLVCTELVKYNQVSQNSLLVGSHILICDGW